MEKYILKDKELLKLQRKYMKNEIQESEIPEEKVEQLKELFREQIKIVEELIEQDKQKILVIRRKLMNN